MTPAYRSVFSFQLIAACIFMLFITVAPQPVSSAVQSTIGDSWAWLNPVATTNDLNATTCASASTCLAVGANETILRTTDSGANWTVSQTETAGATLNDIHCPTASNCIAVGDNTILHSADGGATWASVHVTTNRHWLTVICRTATDCNAMGSQGAIVRSNDAGLTWVEDLAFGSVWLRDGDCLNATNCLIVGDDGRLLLTTEGQTWVDQPVTTVDLVDVECPSMNNCYVVGSNSVLNTQDGGMTWNVSSPSFFGFAAIACPTASTCLAITNNGGIVYRTGDAGASWSIVSNHIAGRYFDALHCINATTCIAVGDTLPSNDVLRTTDGGTTWSTVPSNMPQDFADTSCNGGSYCVAVGKGGALAQSSDSGASWVAVSGAVSDDFVTMSCFATTCLAVGDSGLLFRSADGGASWDATPSGTVNWLKTVNCTSTTQCLAAGSNGTVLASNDGGLSWVAQVSGSSALLYDLTCISATACLIAGSNGTLLRTTNGGTTWSAIATGVTTTFSHITCASASSCIASGSNSMSTSDGGASWVAIAASAGANTTLDELVCLSPVRCISASSKIVISADSGATWTVSNATVTTPPGSAPILSIAAIDCLSITICVAVGHTGVLRTTDGGDSWVTLPAVGNFDSLSDVACDDTTNCIATGFQGVYQSTDSGLTWTNVLGMGANHISCPTSTSCFVVGANGAILRTDGSATPPSTGVDVLAIYALAFDELPDNPANLSSYIYPTIDSLVTASAGVTDKTAIVLADSSGADNTQLYEIYNGTVTLIDGLPTAAGVLDSTLLEYDMTDGATLGGFLLWARAAQPSATLTTFSYVSHGTFVAPETDFANLDNLTRQAGPGLPPLASKWTFTPGLSDRTPEGIVSPQDLAEALRIGTNDGASPLDVADMVHCFAATIEEFYELSNPDGQPYAAALTGSPNFAYFAPEMLGTAFAALTSGDSSTISAEKIIDAYDTVLQAADASDGNASTVEHPGLLVAYESSLVPAIKTSWDETAYYIMQNFDRTKLLTAYNAAAKYDTDFCMAGGDALAAPDALVDLHDFAEAVSAQFGIGSPVSGKALATASALDAAQIARRQRDGIPWFATGSTTPWAFPGNGLGLYADFVGHTPASEPDNVYLSFQNEWYTDTVTAENPQPFLFVQDDFNGVNWADVHQNFWATQTKTVKSTFCMPGIPQAQQDGVELTLTDIRFPITGTVSYNVAAPLGATIALDADAINPEVLFEVIGSSGQTVFTNTVAAGYLPAGTHWIEASADWTPTLASGSSYTLRVTVDADDAFSEIDETDNTATRSDVIATTYTNRKTITATTNQWQASSTVPLVASVSSGSIDYLWVSVHQYVPSLHPHVQVPQTLGYQLLDAANPQLDLAALNASAGIVSLYVWAVVQGHGLVVEPAFVQFNYVPPSFNLAANQSRFFAVTAAEGQTLALTLNEVSGSAELYLWEPDNFWTSSQPADGQNLSVTTMAGEYVIEIAGGSGASTIDLQQSLTRGTQNNSSVVEVDRLRTLRIDPAPIIPDLEPQFKVFLPIVIR